MSSRNNPYEMIERMFDQMSRQFNEASKAWTQEGKGTGGTGLGKMGIDLMDEGDEFVVTVDVPGFERDEINIRIADNILSINATRERLADQHEGTYLRSEREHRSLSERIRFPEPVREDDITASLQNGVLTIHTPKAEGTETSGRQIEIE